MWPVKKEIVKPAISNEDALMNHPIWLALGIPEDLSGKSPDPVYEYGAIKITLAADAMPYSNANKTVDMDINFSGSNVPIRIRKQIYTTPPCPPSMRVLCPAIPASQSEKFFGFILELLDKAMESDDEDMDNLIRHWRG